MNTKKLYKLEERINSWKHMAYQDDHEEIEDLNRLITSREIKSVIKTSQQTKL